MKKTVKIACASIICASLLFGGCTSENKTLAKNLDNTVTNLIYSVSSLDWADGNIVNNLRNPNNAIKEQFTNQDQNGNFFYYDQNTPNNNCYNYDPNNTNSKCYNCNQRDFDSNYYNFNQNNLSNFNQTNRDNYSINNNIQTENRQIAPLPSNNFRNERNVDANYDPRFSGSQYSRQPFYNKTQSTTHMNNAQNMRDQYFMSRNQSNLNNIKEIENIQNFNNLENATNDNTNNPFQPNNLEENQTPKAITPVRLVNFSIDDITNSASEIQEKVSNLISERSTMLLYINDLYKGNVNLTASDRNAINAYMNIIKDNTSYLNQNRGIITNQLSQANDILSTDPNSSLINAYIIRTNEAISSRIVKLDSSISAMRSICEILQGSLKTSSPNYKNNQTLNNQSDLQSHNFNTNQNNNHTDNNEKNLISHHSEQNTNDIHNLQNFSQNNNSDTNEQLKPNTSIENNLSSQSNKNTNDQNNNQNIKNANNNANNENIISNPQTKDINLNQHTDNLSLKNEKFNIDNASTKLPENQNNQTKMNQSTLIDDALYIKDKSNKSDNLDYVDPYFRDHSKPLSQNSSITIDNESDQKNSQENNPQCENCDKDNEIKSKEKNNAIENREISDNNKNEINIEIENNISSQDEIIDNTLKSNDKSTQNSPENITRNLKENQTIQKDILPSKQLNNNECNGEECLEESKLVKDKDCENCKDETTSSMDKNESTTYSTDFEQASVNVQNNKKQTQDKKDAKEEKDINNDVNPKIRENQKELYGKANGKKVTPKHIDPTQETDELDFEEHMEASVACLARYFIENRKNKDIESSFSNDFEIVTLPRLEKATNM